MREEINQTKDLIAGFEPKTKELDSSATAELLAKDERLKDDLSKAAEALRQFSGSESDALCFCALSC